MSRKKLAVFTATGCRACENAILDLHYQVSAWSRWAEVVFWPYLLGSRWEELDGIGRIDVCFFSGAIRTDADERAARVLRAKSAVLVASGACAAFGGMTGLSNLARPEGAVPAGEDSAAPTPPLPRVRSQVCAVSQVVGVDYVVPGCPTPQNYLWSALQSLVCLGKSAIRASFGAYRLPPAIAQAFAAGLMPPSGSVFAGERAVCASCSRRKEEKRFESLKRPHQLDADPGRCLLEQGLICQGVATREGCGGLCTAAGAPCRGCFGKAAEVFDPGAKMVSAISSTFDTTDAGRAEAIADEFVDLAGTFYRYTLPSQCALLRSSGCELRVTEPELPDTTSEACHLHSGST